jgi:hypothetical protein
MTRRFASLVVVIALGVVGQSEAQSAPSGITYRSIELAPFAIQNGVDFPATYQTALIGELIAQLTETKKFERVLRADDATNASTEPTVRLTGTIIEFKAGSRAKRYFVGFGAGQTKIKARIQLVDGVTGELLLEDDVDGRVAIGAFGGEPIGATRGLAKKVAEVASETPF